MSAPLTLLGLMDAAAASDLSSAQRAVLWWVARRAAGTKGRLGEAWPSTADLCKGSGLSRRAVLKNMKELREAGWLVRAGMRKQVVVYTLAVGSNRCTRCTGAGDAPVQEMHQTGAYGAPPPVHEVHPEEASEEALEEARSPRPQQQPPEQPTKTTDWQRADSLWKAVAEPPLSGRGKLNPKGGLGRHLQAVVKSHGVDGAMRALLWMAKCPACDYLRDPSKGPRGYDTLARHRDKYVEGAAVWLTSDPAAARLAIEHGVALPEGCEPPPTPKAKADLQARAQAILEQQRRERREKTRALRERNDKGGPDGR